MLAFLLTLLLLTGQEPRQVDVGAVTVVAWPAQIEVAMALGEIADRPQEWPGLGRRSLGRLRLIVAEDQRRFAEVSRGRAPRWGAGIAVPGARTIVIRADAGDPIRTLRHELAHLALHDAVRVRVPLWFSEGYATWAAGEWGRLASLRLNLAVVTGRVPDLRALDRSLRGSPAGVDAAYALAASAVLELARRNPSGSLEPLLERLGRGEDFGASVLATTGFRLSDFDTVWRKTVRTRYSLLTWLAAGGFWAVLGGAVLALGWFRRRRDIPRRAALDEGWIVPEEAWASPPPAEGP